MHPHTPVERDQLRQPNYGVHSRLRVSTAPMGGIFGPGTIASDTLGYDPLIEYTINADLEQSVMTARLTLHLGRDSKTLSPYMTKGPKWSWTSGPRPLFDAGIYVGIETKCVSTKPLTRPAPPPQYMGAGPVTRGGVGGGLRTPQWTAGHQVGDVALLIAQTDAEAITFAAANGFVEVLNSPQSIGTAGAANATRLTVYWCRATSSTMAAPVINDPGDHCVAQILTWRGCIGVGNPWWATNGATAASGTAVTFSGLVGSPSAIVYIVAHAIPTGLPAVTWSPGTKVPDLVERTDLGTSQGVHGGGFSVASGTMTATGVVASTGVTATLASPSVMAKIGLALRPPDTIEVTNNADLIPWRPVFLGRIDSADPTADGTHLVLECRDQFCDLIDRQIDPPLGQNGWPIEGDNVDQVLKNVLGLKNNTDAIPFAVVGQVDMGIKPFTQEPMGTLPAMRRIGLQNGNDLRGRWGTAPYTEDQWVLTYYAPDRAANGGTWVIGPDSYFRIRDFKKDRSGVRNLIRGTPADAPRLPYELGDNDSQSKYGVLWMAMAEDLTTNVRTAEQIQALVAAVLSDLKEPPVGGTIEVRFLPFVEINDLIELVLNNIHHDADFIVAVTGFTHTVTQRRQRTVLRTRSNPAAAYSEWRKGTPQTNFISLEQPSGTAPERSTWKQYD